MWIYWNLANLREMTCAVWSLGQIPASLTVHWLRGNSSYYFEQYKIRLLISKQIKNYRELLFTEAPALSLPLLPTPCRELTLQHRAVKPWVHPAVHPLEMV